MRNQRITIGILSLGLVVAALPSRAAGPEMSGSYAASPTTPWRNSNTEECGQACLYSKANETIALQALYHFNKIGDLKGSSLSELNREIPGFCLSGEDADQCYNRYKAVELSNLQAMRQAMLKNNDSAKALMSEVAAVSGERTGQKATVVAKSSVEKRPVVPYVITFDDLLKENNHLKYLTENSYNRQLQAIPTCPGKEAYIQKKVIFRNPDDKTAGTMEVLAKNGQGEFIYDEKADAKIAKCEADRKRAIAHIKGDASYGMRTPMPATVKEDIGSKSKDAFVRARMQLVDAANKVLSGQEPDRSPPPEPAAKPKGIEVLSDYRDSRRPIQSQNTVNLGSRTAQVPNQAAATAAGRVPATARVLTGNEKVMDAPATYTKQLQLSMDPDQINSMIEQLQ